MKLLYYTVYVLTNVTARFLGIKVVGLEYIPAAGPFILATNHISHFDPPLAGSFLPREVCFMAKKELFSNWLLGAVFRRVNALPIRRGTIDRHALELCTDALEKELGLVIFPEGTRSKTDDFLPAKAGIGMIARRHPCPVVPGFISGSNRLLDCLRRRQRLSISFGPPIAPGWIGSVPADKSGYLAIAEEVMSRIRKLRDEMPRLKEPAV
ncbi:MAG: lysophospholipid acyltransferase family protein [Candidatus Zixiibacteriota bacterium]